MPYVTMKYLPKWPNLELKTEQKQHFGSLLLNSMTKCEQIHNMSLTFASLVTLKAGTEHGLWIVYIGVVLKAIMLATATCDSHYCTCLGHLGRCDRDRIISIGQGKKIRCNIALDIMFDIANVVASLSVTKFITSIVVYLITL
jgi:hypothetical protein